MNDDELPTFLKRPEPRRLVVVKRLEEPRSLAMALGVLILVPAALVVTVVLLLLKI